MGKKDGRNWRSWVGHPPYAEWFCRNHYEKANELKNLPTDKALKILSSESI